jgi:hypothetical protein
MRPRHGAFGAARDYLKNIISSAVTRLKGFKPPLRAKTKPTVTTLQQYKKRDH